MSLSWVYETASNKAANKKAIGYKGFVNFVHLFAWNTSAEGQNTKNWWDYTLYCYKYLEKHFGFSLCFLLSS